MTKQVEYRGEMMELTESLSHLPAGGQVLLSDTTCQCSAGRLHDLKLPAFTFQCSRGSLDRTRSRISLEGLRSSYAKELVSRLAFQLYKGSLPQACSLSGFHKVIQSCKRALPHALPFPLTHSLTCSATHPLTHSRTSPPTHLLVCSQNSQPVDALPCPCMSLTAQS